MTDDQSIGERIDAAVEEALAQLNTRIDGLQARIDELQEKVEAFRNRGEEGPPQATQLPA